MTFYDVAFDDPFPVVYSSRGEDGGIDTFTAALRGALMAVCPATLSVDTGDRFVVVEVDPDDPEATVRRLPPEARSAVAEGDAWVRIPLPPGAGAAPPWVIRDPDGRLRDAPSRPGGHWFGADTVWLLAPGLAPFHVSSVGGEVQLFLALQDRLARGTEDDAGELRGVPRGAWMEARRAWIAALERWLAAAGFERRP